MDGVSGEDTAVTVGAFDESVDRGLGEGLNGATRLLRERLERGVEALQSPEMGREPASPQTQNQLVCIGIFSAMAVIAMIMCGVSWGCWCCIGVWIILGLAAIISVWCLGVIR